MRAQAVLLSLALASSAVPSVHCVRTVADDIRAKGCSTAVVAGLSAQLVTELNCLREERGLSGAFKSLAGIPRVSLSNAAGSVPFAQGPLVDTLARAVSAAPSSMGSLRVNSALRTLPQQLMLYKWQGSCGISIAAPPGRSNHNGGAAIDVSDAWSWKPHLSPYSFAHLGSRDPPHFNFVGTVIDIRQDSIRAFQRLHNRNTASPSAKLGVDGAYGSKTEKAMLDAPSSGFGSYLSDTDCSVVSGSGGSGTSSDGGGDGECWPTVRRGDKSTDVVTVQFLVGAAPADGDFGPGTERAVEAWERSKGLTADGTITASDWPSLVPTLRRGDKGDLVKALQTALNKHGDTLVVDGDFGPGTESSVRRFQAGSGLSPGDGVAGPTVWEALVCFLGPTAVSGLVVDPAPNGEPEPEPLEDPAKNDGDGDGDGDAADSSAEGNSPAAGGSATARADGVSSGAVAGIVAACAAAVIVSAAAAFAAGTLYARRKRATPYQTQE